MASNYRNVFLVSAFVFVILCGAASAGKLKETNLTFYMHDIEEGENITAVAVAGLNGTKSVVTAFSAMLVTDNAITEGPNRFTSAEIARAQGLYANSALDGSNLHLMFSIVFTNRQYNGSTLEIQGADRFFLKQREVSVVGGTRFFRFARGYAVLETVSVEGLNAAVKVDMTVRHY